MRKCPQKNILLCDIIKIPHKGGKYEKGGTYIERKTKI